MDEEDKTSELKSIKFVLIVILVLELVSLIPWLIYGALLGMGFSSNMGMFLWLSLISYYSYPLLIIIFSGFAFAFAGKGRGGTAFTLMIAPIVIPIVCIILFALLSQVPTKETLSFNKYFDEKCTTVYEKIYKHPRDINGIYIDNTFLATE